MMVTSWTDSGVGFIETLLTGTGFWGQSVGVFNTIDTDVIRRTSFTFDVTVFTLVINIRVLTIWAVTFWSIDSSLNTVFTMINFFGTSSTLWGTRLTDTLGTSVLFFVLDLDGSISRDNGVSTVNIVINTTFI